MLSNEGSTAAIVVKQHQANRIQCFNILLSQAKGRQMFQPYAPRSLN